jgi:hypothetical protein
MKFNREIELDKNNLALEFAIRIAEVANNKLDTQSILDLAVKTHAFLSQTPKQNDPV